MSSLRTSSALHESPVVIHELMSHIRDRTFGRLHDLNVSQGFDGRLRVSAIAHSRFVGQLAEWAVHERIAPADVSLTISVRQPSQRFREVQK
ncbi:hypothetical protein [Schlesneria paludicola]|uniref:hypothetical protein n=1 Tax=Schlesneria paludicola TaxID=360056 RepID=UPI00029AE3F5|nr:hypothetical protein [Schlesneria paludicola]